tara:strand:+ start:56 stop:1180 length:1125 start_codon:yes stop_codon:yes gene_type:complete
MNIVASSPEGLESLLLSEISDLGATEIKMFKRFISFQCDYSTLYRIHFYSRIAFRFYREIARFKCLNKFDLYQGIQSSFDWLSWIPTDKKFCVQVTGKNSLLNHSHYTALQVKNAITDLQQSSFGCRSDISLQCPFLVVHLHLHNDEAIVSLQTTIESLHKRGYRPAVADAPLKENLAAGLIQMTEWDGKKTLIDLMCGSGSFLIEAVSQYLRIPNLIKKSYLFENWIDFKRDIFMAEKLKLNSNKCFESNIAKVIGCEINNKIYKQAVNNISLAGVGDFVQLLNLDFEDLINKFQPGIILCNPPYGKRIGDERELIDLYLKIGDYLKRNFSGWTFWLLSGNPKLTRYLKMKASLKIPINNGGIDCRWIKYLIR